MTGWHLRVGSRVEFPRSRKALAGCPSGAEEPRTAGAARAACAAAAVVGDWGMPPCDSSGMPPFCRNQRESVAFSNRQVRVCMYVHGYVYCFNSDPPHPDSPTQPKNHLWPGMGCLHMHTGAPTTIPWGRAWATDRGGRGAGSHRGGRGTA